MSAESLSKRRVEVFLALTMVHRRGHTTRRPLPVRWAGTWVTRKTTTDLYTSKTCDTREEAEALSRSWLARKNRQDAGVEYVDTTEEGAS